MKNKVQVIMLPTKDKPVKGSILLRHLWKGTKNECKSIWQYNETVNIGNVWQYTTLNGSFRDCISSFEPQHLYITISQDVEPIKEGDYYLWSNKNQIGFVHNINHLKSKHSEKDNFRKIIATTDKSLLIKESKDILYTVNGDNYRLLPQISQQFQEDFCKAGGIWGVKAEYIEIKHCCGANGFGQGIDDKCPKCDGDNPVPKTNSNNEVVVYLIENNGIAYDTHKALQEIADEAMDNAIKPKVYTREEVEQQIYNAISYTNKKWIESNNSTNPGDYIIIEKPLD